MLGSHVTVTVIRVPEASITVVTPMTRITVLIDGVNLKLLCCFKTPTTTFAIERLGNMKLLMVLHMITPLG